ncbi:helix-turn-helix domain-containing protein [Acrocarpospora sp. B8E8]|uniref:helix-turn-helix domain-containing protein n=1 Tax=Acrocarpospora sp. B8E8 TaxID=3153572 RepID=UPI00325CCA99
MTSTSTEIQVTTREAALALRVSVRTVQRHAKAGKLNASKNERGHYVITLAVADEYKAHQVASALELLEQGGLVPTSRPGTFTAVSSDGSTRYLVTRDHCGCKAFEKGRNCYHRLAVALTDTRRAA